MTIVITACTNRKRKSVPDRLSIGGLGKASLPQLAADWGCRLDAAADRFPAKEIYGGRGFQEAVAAADAIDARLMIVSAGLGLVEASSEVPPYACTIVLGVQDSISCQVDGPFSATRWWAELGRVSPFDLGLRDVAAAENGLILAALSDAYIDMVAGDLAALPLSVRSRLRLFTRAPRTRISSDLLPCVMPYDDRLDGPDSPIPGTLSDFASRALRHFVENIFYARHDRSVVEHSSAVSEVLAEWRRPEKVVRRREGDAGILDILRAHWHDRSGISLARLRGEFNIACEQGRYSSLARIVRGELI